MGKYSETLMDHFQSPRNSRVMDAPDLVGRVGELGRGPFMVLYLRMSGDRVERATFQTYGCGSTIACGSVLTELVAGRSAPECLALTPEDLVAALDGVPEDKLHGPAMAVAALRDALERRLQT
jgi:nitrogen fixation NifU-like protein